VHFDGPGWVATPVLDRTGLVAGDRFGGPCIVEELDSTVVLPPGTSATVDAVGNITISLLPDSEVSR
jgi:N-methylhydantoinase A/oxoprolinase/acetone carboxylase beta subunit